MIHFSKIWLRKRSIIENSKRVLPGIPISQYEQELNVTNTGSNVFDKYKFVLTDKDNRSSRLINTNSEVLASFSSYDKDHKLYRWCREGMVTTETQFHYLDNENPIRLASILNQEFKANIEVQSFERLQDNIETVQNVSVEFER